MGSRFSGDHIAGDYIHKHKKGNIKEPQQNYCL